MIEGLSSSMMYLIHYKNFCKCHKVPPACMTIKKKRNRINEGINEGKIKKMKRQYLFH
jgi:hypothetical protein